LQEINRKSGTKRRYRTLVYDQVLSEQHIYSLIIPTLEPHHFPRMYLVCVFHPIAVQNLL
jgi:hypothetical protein